MHFPAFQASHHLGPHIHGLHNLGAAPRHSHVLKELSHSVEQHNAYCLRKVSDGKGGQGSYAHEEVLVKHMALPQVPESSPDNLPAQQHVGDDIAHGGPQRRRPHMLCNLPCGKKDCSHRNDKDFLSVFLENTLLLCLPGWLYLLPGSDCHLLLYGGADLPEFGQKLLLVTRRHPELLCGKGDGSHLHARQLPDLSLHLGRAVGAFKSFQNVDSLFYAGGYIVKFPACVVYLLMMMLMVMFMAMFMMVLVVVMMLVAAVAGLMLVVMLQFSFFSKHSNSSLHRFIYE